MFSKQPRRNRFQFFRNLSDVVETGTWLKLRNRDRDFAIKAKTETQNRRQKVVNKGALHFCKGLWICAVGLDTVKIDKNSTDV